jgi:hypothetical protein
MELAPAEARVLRECLHAADTWGYNSAADGDHTRYELRTHEDWLLHPIQQVTDKVFRNVRRLVQYGQDKIFAGDVGWDDQSSLSDVWMDDLTFDRVRCASVVQEYFRDNGPSRHLICGLAKCPTHGSTAAFALIVTHARAMFAIAALDFEMTALLFRNLENMKASFDGVYPEHGFRCGHSNN